MTDPASTRDETTPATGDDTTAASRDAWMLEELVQLPHVLFAVVFTADGMLRDYRGDLGRDAAEKRAAGCCAILSASRAVMGDCAPDEPFRDGMCATEGHRMFLRSAAPPDERSLFASLAVFTTASASAALVASAMAERVARPGDAAWFTPARG
ncbi:MULTISPECIES: roadblock/LC7 domain-containing protein [Actinomycetes]|uniref:roadblock/LC7 domain-containing protein n=1 Tax=Actinomycetes TaxID=1760 RepID=UPI0001B556D7|nr:MULTISPECIES: roadblock/LC7 domain-containing protein [Actinomycetes]EFL12468.1 predicted protein [Streptomyces sp. AA4]